MDNFFTITNEQCLVYNFLLDYVDRYMSIQWYDNTRYFIITPFIILRLQGHVYKIINDYIQVFAIFSKILQQLLCFFHKNIKLIVKKCSFRLLQNTDINKSWKRLFMKYMRTRTPFVRQFVTNAQKLSNIPKTENFPLFF